MNAYSPYQSYPGQAPDFAPAPPSLFLAVAEPAPQRRLTVFFRNLMLFPHYFLLSLVGLAAGVVAFVGWWGALFTGQLPEFAVTFLSGFLRWTTRVAAYGLLLTEVYPPFTLDEDPTYPVRVAIPEPRPLNRAAVFFRAFIAFPAALLIGFIGFGAGLVLVIAWVITLVAGQMPASLHHAYVALLRFQVRYAGYYYMLTSAYPSGLYGDKPGTVAWPDQAPGAQAAGFAAPGPAYGSPSYGSPSYGSPAYGTPQGYGAPQGGYGAPQGYGTPQGFGAPQGYGGPQAYGTSQGPDTPRMNGGF